LLWLLAGCSPRAAEQPLVFVGADKQVYRVLPSGGAPERVSEVSLPAPRQIDTVFYQWPTWSADGQSLAYIRIARPSSGNGEAAVLVSRADGSAARAVFESATDGTSAITPFYLS